MADKGKKEFMKEAVAEAVRGVLAGDGGPFGAVIVRDGEVVSKAHNMVIRLNDPTAHAEILAIRGACATLGRFSLEDCQIYSSCEPCPMCFSAVHWARIPVLYFGCTRSDAERIGFDDSLLYKMLQDPGEKASFKIKRTGREDALEAFELWEAKTDKVAY
ncbi:MAG: nucleoside deaminase [Victivallales bacterium]|nr:nucleoside deaminase [Victivallales bacterium]